MLLVVVALVGGYLAFRSLDRQVQVLRPDLGPQRPARVAQPGPTQPLNVLVIGSDDRTGQSTIKGTGGDLSDTTILLHVSADRQRAYGVSVPRDLMVSRPDCPSKTDGDVVVPGASPVMFNTAYGVGHEGCTVRTFEKMTGIRVDHFVVVKFDGVKQVADAVGGVPVCVPQPMGRPGTAGFLPAGSYAVEGDQALAYVRTRLGVGEGSDIGRMRRQQEFLASLSNQVLEPGVLANPFRLYSVVDSVLAAVQVDPGLGSLSKVARLARQLRSLGASSTTFFTMPITAYPPNPNRVAAGPRAPELWRLIRRDEAVPRELLESSTSAADAPGRAAPAGRAAPLGATVAAAPPALDDEAERYGLCS